MPKVSVSVPHEHDPDEIVKRARPHIEEMIDDFDGQDLEVQWSGRQGKFSFISLAFKITGDIVVDDQKITTTIDLPLPALLFKEKIEQSIHKNLTLAVQDDH